MQTEAPIPEQCNPTLWKDENGHWCSRLVPPLILAACLCTLIVIPFKVIGYGYLPSDDALRHAGKVMSERTWDEILVSDKAIPDTHVGWHMFLGAAKNVFGLEADGVAVFSVVVLFLVLAVPPIVLHRRPENWTIALLIGYLSGVLGARILFGRPFLGHSAVILVMLLSRRALNAEKNRWAVLVPLTVLMMISIWWRTLWFLYALPIGAFVLARQWRAVIRLAIIWGVATVLAGLACGNPLLLVDTVTLTLRVMGSAEYATQLVTELQPFAGNTATLLAVIILLVIVQLRGRRVLTFLDSPAFYLLAVSWLLGCTSKRWWIDFGSLAFVAVISAGVELFSEDRTPLPWFSVGRLFVAVLSCGLLFGSYTSDIGGRWTRSLRNEYVDIEDESIRDGLPGKDGIIYNTNMATFYQTFFTYPNAEWRYILGFESALMPEEDLAILRNIQWNSHAWEAHQPWVEKMRPQDRMWITQGVGASEPGIDGLVWERITTYIWSGRLPREGEEANAGTGTGSGSAGETQSTDETKDLDEAEL